MHIMADHPLAKRLDVLRKMSAEARRDAARATSSEESLRFEKVIKLWDQLIKEIEGATESDKRA